MSMERFHRLVKENTWTFAKTMAWCPHEYTLRKNFRDDKDFEWMAKYIREHGVAEIWKSPRSSYTTNFTYLYLNGWKYWTMGCPLHNCEKTGTVVINRARYKKPSESSYDTIATEYESVFGSDEYTSEDRQLFSALAPFIRGKVLDIGCGTGLLLDNRSLLPNMRDYLGIDESSGMLKVMYAKHRDVRMLHDRFGRTYTGKHDTVVALYGTASYFNDFEFRLVAEHLADGGTFILMRYADEYYPLTHELFNIPYEKSTAAAILPEPVFTCVWLGKYEILTNNPAVISRVMEKS